MAGVPDAVLTPKLRRQMVHKATCTRRHFVLMTTLNRKVMLSAASLKRYDAKRMMLGNANT